MLSSVLRSKEAINVNIVIIHAYVKTKFRTKGRLKPSFAPTIYNIIEYLN